jgi:anti-anti-sigma factor
MMSKSEYQGCQVAVLDQVGLIKMPSTLTVLEAMAFKQTFQQICKNNPNLVRAELDFSQTGFIDSMGIGALVNILKMANQNQLELILLNVSSQVMMALSLTGLDKTFEIQTSIHQPLTETSADSLPQKRRKKAQPLPTHASVKSRAKRVVDIVGAFVGLGITAILFVPIAIAIQIDDPGPIFFGQVRCSWLGSRFKMWKFRSMVADAEKLKHLVENEVEGPIFKSSNDPRITRVGRFLRKTSLDELPQFWNVLRGEMSLVGTRPPTPDEIEKYEISQWQRLDVKPGMTGEWQVNGRSQVKSFEDVIRLDLQYQKNWSLMYDFQLILKTILILFNKKSGAM